MRWADVCSVLRTCVHASAHRRIMLVAMSRRSLVWLALMVVTGCSPSPAPPPPPAPLVVPKLESKTRPAASSQPPRADRQATPEDARDYAIELLESERYEELIEKLLSPKDLERVKNRKGGLARVVSEFSTSEKHTELLATLKSVRDVKPETTEEGRVRFAIPGKGGDVTFENVEGRWYIKN